MLVCGPVCDYFEHVSHRMDAGMTASYSSLQDMFRIEEEPKVRSEQDGRQDMARMHHDITHVEGCWRHMRFVVKGQRVTHEQARAHVAAGAAVHALPELAGGGSGMSVRALVLY